MSTYYFHMDSRYSNFFSKLFNFNVLSIIQKICLSPTHYRITNLIFNQSRRCEEHECFMHRYNTGVYPTHYQTLTKLKHFSGNND